MALQGLVESFDRTGDFVTAFVLEQVRFWFTPNKKGESKLTAKPGWFIKSHKEWWDEYRLTRKQVRRALTRLEKLGIIKIEIHKFRGSPTVHIKLIGLVPQGQSIGPTGPILYTEKTYIDSKVSKDTLSSPAWPENVHALHATGKTMKSSQDVLKELEDKKKDPEVLIITTISDTKKNKTGLATWWDRIVPKYHWGKIDGIHKSCTNVDKAHLKNFLDSVGPDLAYTVMRWTIINWDDFVMRVHALNGDKLPQLPNTGKLKANWNHALKMYKDSLQLTAPESQEEPSVIIYAKKQGLKT